jgi:hypothetical protein
MHRIINRPGRTYFNNIGRQCINRTQINLLGEQEKSRSPAFIKTALENYERQLKCSRIDLSLSAAAAAAGKTNAARINYGSD